MKVIRTTYGGGQDGTEVVRVTFISSPFFESFLPPDDGFRPFSDWPALRADLAYPVHASRPFLTARE